MERAGRGPDHALVEHTLNESPRPRVTLAGILAGLALSGVNLLGAFLAIAALGGLGEWSPWQFIGFFALMEVAAGVGFIICPNIWHLPVAQAKSGVDVRLAASTILIPHWAPAAKAAAGLLLLVAVAAREGIGPGTAGVPVWAALALGVLIGLSLLVARLGVARPDLDVVQFVIRRPGKPDRSLPALSLSASVVQLFANLGALPLVKVLEPSVLYRPEFGPSPRLLAWTAALCAALLLAAYALWRPRMSWRAPRAQQREAERLA